jgi:hypothetical protein
VDLVGSVQNVVLLLLGLGSLALTGFAFFDAVRRQAKLFPHAGRFSKNVWLGILGAALALAIVSLFNPLFFLNVVGVIAAAIYLADLRPKLRQLGGGGSGSGYGPYGPY